MAAFFPSPGGFGDFCERLADRVVKGGGELLTNAAIEHIDLDGSVVRSVGVNGRTERADWLIWTGDLGVLCRLLGIPADLAFPFLNVVLFNLEVTGSATHDYLWVEYADPACLVDRACLNNLYRPLNAPPGYHGVSAEVWCRADHEVWKDPESFVGEVQENLVRAGVVASRDRVVGCHIERIPRVWPILGLDYRERLERAMALVLARARNLYLTNRAGAGFQTLDRVIESALAVSGTICHGAGSNDPWASDGTHRRCAE